VEGFYEERVYEGDQAIASPIFPEVQLTAAQVLQKY
jgi:Uma2 family endonuclease